MKKMLFLILVFSLQAVAVEVTPTVRVNQSIEFLDDMEFGNLDLAIDRQIESYNRIGLAGSIKFGTLTYPKSVLKDSLLLLKSIVNDVRNCEKGNPKEACRREFNNRLNSEFAIYTPKVSGRKAKTQFTSYYSPDLHGSRVRTERFKNPVYRTPDAGDRDFTRTQIDYHGALDGKGYEIFYVEESFYDLYLLHVQGGGRIHIYNPDGIKEIKYLSYDWKNNHSFQMVYKYMLEKGYITSGNAGIPAQRKFLDENPEKQEEVFSVCPSYVYFKETDEEPVGLNNIPLTEGRSLAIDSRIYKTMGILNFVKTVKASHVDENGKVVKVPFSRFFIAQDTGGAIRGAARSDLYFGYGPLAELTAYNMNEKGDQYFLVKKMD